MLVSSAIRIRMATARMNRLPGYGRNSFLGPDYATTDLRLTRRLYVRPRLKLELVAEAFNALNRDNRRVQITDDGLTSTATNFTQIDKTIGINHFPAYNGDRKSTRLNSSHQIISYAVFCLNKKNK